MLLGFLLSILTATYTLNSTTSVLMIWQGNTFLLTRFLTIAYLHFASILKLTELFPFQKTAFCLMTVLLVAASFNSTVTGAFVVLRTNISLNSSAEYPACDQRISSLSDQFNLIKMSSSPASIT